MVFIDSNIWLYLLLAHQSSSKSAASRALIQNHLSNIAISSQVIIEVAANLLRKGSFSEPQVAKFIEDAYAEYTVVDISEKVMLHASTLRSRYILSYFDSLIVAAAIATDSTTLYSEDMHDGLVIENILTIVNPFAAL